MAPDVVPFLDDSAAPAVCGAWHAAAAPATGDGLVLAHGAGSNRDAPLLVAVAEASARRGLIALRCDLPFRQASPQGPPLRGGAERDRIGLARAVESVRSRIPGRVLLGGHSYGGRQASMLAAERPALAAALLLLSYPLHPPRRPQELRTGHFENLRTPALFIHGARDPFGAPDAVRAAMARISAPTTLLVVEGAGHDLIRRGRPDTIADLGQRVVEALLALIDGRANRESR